MTKERNIKTENTFSVLQEENTEPLRKEEEPPQSMWKKGKMENKSPKQTERRKRNGTQSRITKNTTLTEGLKKKCGSLRCKSAKYHNECYKCKTKECLNYMINSTTHNREEKKYKNWKKNYRAVFRKREHRYWDRRGEDSPVRSCSGWQTKKHQKTK